MKMLASRPVVFSALGLYAWGATYDLWHASDEHIAPVPVSLTATSSGSLAPASINLGWTNMITGDQIDPGPASKRGPQGQF
jgi:hypothetical protein